jgi:hypothetical protein
MLHASCWMLSLRRCTPSGRLHLSGNSTVKVLTQKIGQGRYIQPRHSWSRWGEPHQGNASIDASQMVASAEVISRNWDRGHLRDTTVWSRLCRYHPRRSFDWYITSFEDYTDTTRHGSMSRGRIYPIMLIENSTSLQTRFFFTFCCFNAKIDLYFILSVLIFVFYNKLSEKIIVRKASYINSFTFDHSHVSCNVTRQE